MQSKNEIRRRILMQRRALESSKVTELSKKVCAKIQTLESYEEVEHLCIYMPINQEVDVTYLAEIAWEQGKKVWLPVTQGKKMKFVRYKKDMVLNIGNYGIMEPDSEEILEAGENTLIVMPGAVFSEKGDRIGYGGGYYDRYLAEYPQCRTCAAAYDFQIVESLPAEQHDIRPEFIITEEKVICSQIQK